MPPRTITLSEPHNTSIQSIPGKKIAISPLKTPSKVNSTHHSFFFFLPCLCGVSFLFSVYFNTDKLQVVEVVEFKMVTAGEAQVSWITLTMFHLKSVTHVNGNH